MRCSSGSSVEPADVGLSVRPSYLHNTLTMLPDFPHYLLRLISPLQSIKTDLLESGRRPVALVHVQSRQRCIRPRELPNELGADKQRIKHDKRLHPKYPHISGRVLAILRSRFMVHHDIETRTSLRVKIWTSAHWPQEWVSGPFIA